MKKTILTLAALVSIGTMQSQTIEVKEGSDKFSTGTQNSLSEPSFTSIVCDCIVPIETNAAKVKIVFFILLIYG